MEFAVVTRTFVALRAFETHAFPWTWRVAPPATGTVPIPRFDKATKVKVFKTLELILVEIRFIALSAFEAHKFPWTWSVGPPTTGVVPTPRFEKATNVKVLSVVELILVERRLVALSAFDAHKFPWTWRVGPPTTGTVPMPTLDAATKVKVLSVVALILVEMRLPELSAFEAHKFPWT